MHGMAKFLQIEANAFFASASSKQKRVPFSPCSTHNPPFVLVQYGMLLRAVDPIAFRELVQSNNFSRSYASEKKTKQAVMGDVFGS